MHCVQTNSPFLQRRMVVLSNSGFGSGRTMLVIGCDDSGDTGILPVNASNIRKFNTCILLLDCDSDRAPTQGGGGKS